MGDVLGSAHGRVAVGVLGGGVGGEEVEGLLGLGQDPDRVRTTYVEVARVAECADPVGQHPDGGVERDQVGLVEDQPRLPGAGGTAAVTTLHLPRAQCPVVVGDRAVRIGVEPGLVDEHTDAVRIEPARLPRQEPVRMPGRDHVEVT